MKLELGMISLPLKVNIRFKYDFVIRVHFLLITASLKEWLRVYSGYVFGGVATRPQDYIAYQFDSHYSASRSGISRAEDMV